MFTRVVTWDYLNYKGRNPVLSCLGVGGYQAQIGTSDHPGSSSLAPVVTLGC